MKLGDFFLKTNKIDKHLSQAHQEEREDAVNKMNERREITVNTREIPKNS